MENILKFDKEYWQHRIKRHDWYIEIADLYDKFEPFKLSHPQETGEVKRQFLLFFEESLLNGSVKLAETNPDPSNDLQNNRSQQQIDTIVIHHTSWPEPATPSRLDAAHLLNVYSRYYLSNYQKTGVAHPIYSGHYDSAGQQIFRSYHHLVRENGNIDQLLNHQRCFTSCSRVNNPTKKTI